LPSFTWANFREREQVKLRRYVGRVIPPVIFMLLLPVALAAPTVMSRDRADNALYFTYDADDDSIETATSSVRHRRDDPVSFITTIDETDKTLPLAGMISLRLNAKRPVIYDGTFTLTVTDSNGDVAFSGSKERSFTLRPKSGARNTSMRFLFDLPSGDYEVHGRFVASS
jgi:hypothetical protein